MESQTLSFTPPLLFKSERLCSSLSLSLCLPMSLCVSLSLTLSPSPWAVCPCAPSPPPSISLPLMCFGVCYPRVLARCGRLPKAGSRGGSWSGAMPPVTSSVPAVAHVSPPLAVCNGRGFRCWIAGRADTRGVTHMVSESDRKSLWRALSESCYLKLLNYFSVAFISLQAITVIISDMLIIV